MFKLSAKRVLGLAIFSLFIGCAFGPDVKDGAALTTTIGNGPKISLQVERGNFWMHKAKLGFMTIKVTPQIAIWVEDSMGTITTLYVTKAFAKQDWKFAKLGADTCARTMSMPYWLNRLRAKNMTIPTKNAPFPDAITAATPAGSFTLATSLPEGFVKGTLYFEINKSFDNNDSWPAKKDYTSFNGQPPLVYSAKVDIQDSTLASWNLSLLGMSGETGTDAKLYPVDSKITTAKDMIKSITIKKL